LQYTTSLPRSKIFYERGFIWCALILSLSFMSYFSYTFYLTNRRKGGCDKILVAAPYFLMQDSFFTTSSLNGILLPTPRPQVTIFIKHEKLFFEIVPCGSELNGRLKTSW
ncbi:TPA: hypothetical protein QFI16_002494, partial [Enterococcus faecium]